jgi:histidinol phosphatase-like enzyme
MVGDQESDIVFGKKLGCRVVQVKGNAEISESTHYYSDDLISAANWIVNDVAKKGG